MFECRICGSSGLGATHSAREMMFGSREVFAYDQCEQCSSLQIREIPQDMAQHYPADYLADSAAVASWPRRWVRKHRFRQILGYDHALGRVAARLGKGRSMAAHLARVGVRLADAVLEVGSGRAGLLLDMRDAGFTDLTGVDPYFGRADEQHRGVRIVRGTLNDVDGLFDLILFNHSLEHVADPERELRSAADHLRSDGRILVSLPVTGTYAWRTYGTDWVQLDSPRHLAIPSEEGMRTLAARTGFDVEDVVYDSTAFQFWGSEQYRREIPLMDPRSHFVNPKALVFSRDQLAEWEARARQLNEAHDGDSACFFLRKR